MNSTRRRSGFTLAEVLVATLFFSVGILGLAASATAIAAQAGQARELARAARFAGSVLDSLRALPCSALASGVATEGRATLQWNATPAPRTVDVAAVLTIPHRGGARTWPLETLVPCG
ncbi:MAG TPA: hypothetical protein VF178_04705 [Gemmatimonadaceae bacterium]